MDGLVDSYVGGIKCWEPVTCPCFFCLPLVGCIFLGEVEKCLKRKYDRVLDHVQHLANNGALVTSEVAMFNEVKRSRMIDPHWGRVKYEGLNHLYLLRYIANSALGNYSLILSELQADIAKYKERVGCWECYSGVCCYFDGLQQDQIHRLYFKIRSTMQGLYKNGILGPEYETRWNAIGFMTDPHWGRVKDEGLLHVREMEQILEEIRPSWDSRVANFQRQGTSTVGVSSTIPSAPVLPLSMEKNEGTPIVMATAVVSPGMNESKVSVSGTTLNSRLLDLKSARDKGLLSEDEYRKAKASVLDSFTS